MKIINNTILIFVLLAVWSCETSPEANIVMLVTANVHGQLDPCG
jgi:hypothetical protein